MVYIILGNGFEEIEAVAPCDILRRGDVPVSYAAVGTSKAVKGSHGIILNADILIKDIDAASVDAIVVPGGMGGVNTIMADKATMELIDFVSKSDILLSAICAGPSVLAKLGLLDGKNITCYPGTENRMGKANCKGEKAVVSDGNIITGRAPGSSLDFGLKLLTSLKDAQTAEKVRESLVY